ncbi:hypothetical protein, partial [Sansalvadorimonas verongulae]|uniref:hypothetical protein n=1 Tax=Sansalvadorimonas verongulae TaxID=2172824 RepID=UPI001E467C80
MFRLNFIVTSLCIVISLSSSDTFAVKVKSKPIRSIQLRPLDVISTGDIAIQNADSTHIHPHKTTSCAIDRTTEHHLVLCRGKKQKNGLTLTTPTPANIWPLKQVPQHGSGIRQTCVMCLQARKISLISNAHPFLRETCFLPGFRIQIPGHVSMTKNFRFEQTMISLRISMVCTRSE